MTIQVIHGHLFRRGMRSNNFDFICEGPEDTAIESIENHRLTPLSLDTPFQPVSQHLWISP